MSRLRRPRMATATIAAVFTFLALTGTALAFRRADRPELRAITRVLARHPGDCGARRVTRLYSAVISTANPRYAGAACLGHFYVVMRRPSAHSEAWRIVLPIGDNPPKCSVVVKRLPRNVIHDLHIGGFGAGGRELNYC